MNNKTQETVRASTSFETHVDAFCKAMVSKGYDGHFEFNHEPIGKLADAFRHYLEQVWSMTTPSFDLTTFYIGRSDNSPYVKIAFRTTYSSGSGFQIKNITLTHANRHVTLNLKHLNIQSLEDIPERADAYRMIVKGTKPLVGTTTIDYPSRP